MAKQDVGATRPEDDEISLDERDDAASSSIAPSLVGMHVTNLSGKDSPFQAFDGMLTVETGGRYSVGSLKKRSKQVASLSAEEERDLARRVRKNSDPAAFEQLTLSYLPLTTSMARAFGSGTEDANQAALLGLIKAIPRFDPDAGGRLSSYAVHYIKAELMTLVLKSRREVSGVGSTKGKRRLIFNLRSLTSSLRGQGSNRYNPEGHIADPARSQESDRCLSSVEIAEIAHRLRVAEADVRDVEVESVAGRDVHLSVLEDHDEPSSHENEPGVRLERKHRHWLGTQGVRLAMKNLSARDRDIIESRWIHVDDDGRVPTLSDLAKRYGISTERVRQIEVSAMSKMRKVMNHQGIRQAVS